MSPLHFDGLFPFLSSLPASQLPQTLLRLTCDMKKTALGSGAKSLLRELQVLGS